MNIAIILAGGIGARMGAGKPKQYIEIDGETMLFKVLRVFSEAREIDGIILVSQNTECDKEIAKSACNEKILAVVKGGATRRESSYIGVQTAAKFARPRDIVLIHDAARPFVDGRIIAENIEAAKKYGACETAIPSFDTVIRAKKEGDEAPKLQEFVPRDEIYLVQTPQSFRLSVISEAHENALAQPKETLDKITDDAGLVLLAGGEVAIVNGSRKNIKVTTKDDLL